jgi:hypothetical protein
MFLVDNGVPTDARNLTREHVETYVSVQVERFRPKTASIRFGDLQPFFKWAVEEREMDSSPMINMRRPHVPEEPPPVLTEDDLRRPTPRQQLKEFQHFHSRRTTNMQSRPSGSIGDVVHECGLAGSGKSAKLLCTERWGVRSAPPKEDTPCLPKG